MVGPRWVRVRSADDLNLRTADHRPPERRVSGLASGVHSAAELTAGFDAEAACRMRNLGFGRAGAVAGSLSWSQDSDAGHGDVLVSGHQAHIAWVAGHNGD